MHGVCNDDRLAKSKVQLMVFVNEIIMLQVNIIDCNLKIQVNKW